MLPVCTSIGQLAAQDAKRLKDMARVCVSVCRLRGRVPQARIPPRRVQELRWSLRRHDQRVQDRAGRL